MAMQAHIPRRGALRSPVRRSPASAQLQSHGKLMQSLSSIPPRPQRACAECAKDPSETQVFPQLEVGPADDAFEREADVMAKRVMARRDPADAAQPMVQRKTTEEEPEDQVRAKHTAASPGAGETIAASKSQLTSGGREMPGATQDFFASRFGQDFSDVRLHEGPQADALNQSISARAFTYGNHIWLSRSETPAPTFTMAHELAHVVQQTGGPARAPRVQRLTHGPSTPTNCHNWGIGLPPWIAGSLAHLQANVYFAMNPGSAGRILPEVTMPRGTKALMGVIDPGQYTAGYIPPGFVDTVGVKSGSVGLGEIKSTASAALATPQAAHYLMRHNEWMARAPWSDTLDISYGTTIGGLKAGTLLSGLATGSGVMVGPFIGDPLKQFHVEADSSGAICYWCTGTGLLNPALARALQRAFREAIDAFWEAYRAISEFIDDVLDWIGDNPVLAFVILVLLIVVGIILAILGGLLEVPSAGTSTPITLGGAGLALSAALALLVLLGVDTSGIAPPTRDMAAMMNERSRTDTPSGADYERDADRGNWASTVAEHRQGQEAVYQAFVTGLSGLPATLSETAANYLNPLSGSEGPALTAESLAFATDWANRLQQSPDPGISDIGRHAQTLAGRIVV